MLTKVVIAVCLVGLVAAYTPFEDCGSTARVLEVRAENCTAHPCRVERGTNVTVNFDFLAAAPAATIDTHLYGHFANLDFPWPGTLPPGCSSLLAGDCPVEENEFITYTSILQLQSNWPSLNADARWELRDETGQLVVCFSVPVHLL